MAQHEPTTEEIVNALRTCEDQDCDSYEYGNKYACEYLIRVHAADRLEQLQRENEELTARAERAEKALENAKIRHARKDAEMKHIFHKEFK